jgi:formylglycine-generating enzyme required for sulfatase activity
MKSKRQTFGYLLCAVLSLACGLKAIWPARAVPAPSASQLTAAPAQGRGRGAARGATNIEKTQLAWFDRTGKLLETVGEPGVYRGVELSPDGKRIAVHAHNENGTGGDIWVFEENGRKTRLTTDSDGQQDNASPAWSPDGKRIAFGSRRNGLRGLYTKAADGTGMEEPLMLSGARLMPMSWSPAADSIVYWTMSSQNIPEQWLFRLSEDRTAIPLLRDTTAQSHAQVSPDGKWIAYQGGETGRSEIYIRSFPGGANKKQVSTSGGVFVRWRSDGKELYFLSAANLGKLMVSDIRIAGAGVEASVPRALFDSPYQNFGHFDTGANNATDGLWYHTYAVSPDGQRFLIPRPSSASNTPPNAAGSGRAGTTQSGIGGFAGRILDANGRPAAGIRVSAMEAASPGVMSAADIALMGLAQTDSNGHYRLEGIPAGRYVVQAGELDLPTYYPGGSSLDRATVITVRASETLPAIDFSLANSTFYISGRVVGPISAGATVALTNDVVGNRGGRGARGGRGGRGAVLTPNVTTPVGANGAFEFRNLRPGAYTLEVPDAILSNATNVTVTDRDIMDVVLRVPPAVGITGSVVVEGGGLRPPFIVTFTPYEGGVPPGIATVGSNGTFATRLPEGEYRLSWEGLPQGYRLKSAVSGSVDLLNVALAASSKAEPRQIVVTLSVASPPPWVKVSGRVRDPGNAPPSVPVRVNLASTPSAANLAAIVAQRGQAASALTAIQNLLAPSPASDPGMEASVNADGSFEFPMVLPGAYSLRVTPTSATPGNPVAITVTNKDLSNVEVIIPAPPSPPAAPPPGTPSASQPTGPIAGTARDAQPAIEFARIQPGTFLMGCSPGDNQCRGDEMPAHSVTISKGFELGKFEVTQAQWQAVTGSNPSSFKGDSRPVENVSWIDVQEFLLKLNARNDGHHYRLPTEAEWEYAARAGATGPAPGALDAVAWYEANSGGPTHPVGQKQPNAWGLYDVLGNVSEWVHDWSGSYPGAPQTDPKGPTEGNNKMVRGGAWNSFDRSSRLSYRYDFEPTERINSVGFRVLREAIP